MARMARLVVPGYPHHVTQRGNRNQQTFFTDEDYRAYMQLVKQSCNKTGTEIWAYCLMPNHVHLVVVPSHEDGLRAALSEAHRKYTKRINMREGWRGYLWQGRFNSFVMDERYLIACARYVELNPVRAGLVKKPEQWVWSSATAHLKAKDDGFVNADPLLDIIPDWSGYLNTQVNKNDLDKIRSHNMTGRPVGAEDWLHEIEQISGRSLKKKKTGPKPKR